MPLILRSVKQTELTWTELDGNFTYLDNRIDAVEQLVNGNEVVKVTAQPFLPAQEDQARTNIKAASAQALIDLEDRFNDLETMGVVTYAVQQPTAQQQQTARDNIAALGTADLDGFVYDVTYNSTNHQITFYSQNEPNIVIDLPIEQLIKGVQLVGDDLVFTFEDGSTVTVPLNSLLVGVVKSVNGLTPNSQGAIILNITDIPGLSSELATKANQNGNNTVGGFWRIDQILSPILLNSTGNSQVFNTTAGGRLLLGNPDLTDLTLEVSDINKLFVYSPSAGSGRIWNEFNFNPTNYAQLSQVYTQSQVNTLLNDKVDKVAGKQLSTEDYTSAEKTKLNNIQAGAEVNVNADWNATTGDAQILNKPTIPTNNNQLANGAGYQNASQVTAEVTNQISALGLAPKGFEFIHGASVIDTSEFRTVTANYQGTGINNITVLPPAFDGVVLTIQADNTSLVANMDYLSGTTQGIDYGFENNEAVVFDWSTDLAVWVVRVAHANY